MLYESQVRVCVLLYLEAKGRSQPEMERDIRAEEKNGFVWMNQLYTLLQQYEAERTRYSTLNNFMPRIAEFFNTLPPREPALIAAFDHNSAHVNSVQPIANRATNVDPTIQELVIGLDKPLDPKRGYSINYGEGGKEHYPIIGKPEFLPGNQALKLHVALKPHWSYAFTLTSLGFATPDGYPLGKRTKFPTSGSSSVGAKISAWLRLS
jgi:hypothetical protein